MQPDGISERLAALLQDFGRAGGSRCCGDPLFDRFNREVVEFAVDVGLGVGIDNPDVRPVSGRSTSALVASHVAIGNI